MLKLASETCERWTRAAVERIDDVLLDHAHCEKKAAGAAVRLLFRYPQYAFLQAPIAALAREELEHFERLLGVLERRGVPFASQKPSAYGGRLQGLLRTHEPAHLIDLLLVSALIEARSCERFQRLADSLPDPELAALYRELLVSEARHHRLYVELAERLDDAERVRERLRELAGAEAEILREPAARVRLHS